MKHAELSELYNWGLSAVHFLNLRKAAIFDPITNKPLG